MAPAQPYDTGTFPAGPPPAPAGPGWQPNGPRPYAQQPYPARPPGPPHPAQRYGPQPDGPQYGPQPYGPQAYRPQLYGPQPYGPQPYGAPTYGPAPYGYPYGAPLVKKPWVTEPPPGTPYHRMVRTAAQRWWQPIAGTVAIVATGFAAVLVVMLVVAFVQVLFGGAPEFDDDSGSGSLFGNATADLGFELFTIAVFLPFILLAAWLFQRRRPGTLSSVVGRLRWRWMLVCCGLALLFCAVSFGAAWAASGFVDEPAENTEWVGWGPFIAPAIVILALVPFQSAAEEYLFRGWLLQSIASCTLETRRAKFARMLSVAFRTPWPAIVISGALFVSLHGYTGWGMLDIFCFAVVTGWLAVRTGGLEASIAMHVFNNLMAFLLSAAVGELDIEQGGVPWQYVVADVLPMALFAAAVVWLARRRRLPVLTPGPALPDDRDPVPGVPGVAAAAR